jgi:phosphonopyruvate decarboxylase
MGHTSHIALSVALEKSDKKITVIDGDGAVLMHMGSLPMIGSKKLNNFRHIVLNNAAHDSVGGQPTIAQHINLCQIARASGYQYCYKVKSKEELIKVLSGLQRCSVFIEVLVRKGTRKNLGRPKTSPIETKIALMRNLL